MDAIQAVEFLLTPRMSRDPAPAYAALHAHGPIVAGGPGLFFVCGYEAVAGVLRDPQARTRLPIEGDFGRAVALFDDSMLRSDPPHHTRMRRLASGVFTARRVAGLQDTITGQVAEIIDGLPAYGIGNAVDLMTHLAYPLPIAVITALLGVPEGDRGMFRRLATDLTAVLEVRWTMADQVKADAAAEELEDYFQHLVDVRRKNPAGDLVTALAEAHEADGDTLTARELLGNLALLLVAGFETTTNLLANGVVLLLDHPGYATALRDDPGRAPAYVEEILRVDSPVQATVRFFEQPARVGGITVARHDELTLLLGAANRDPARFANPSAFDPDRPRNAPLSFGAGEHYCLGAPLARLEAQVALPALLRAFPAMALVGRPRRRDRMNLRGWDTLIVDLHGAP
ncbi:cytochrome P450 [Actinoplanes sp. TBRC 11911]|uniref:cytochrome P450 n=1 Tax=Actinoplanes sp. TBRC 11911 TaxID=2729386 RepID=UPI00145D990B|nr:cytochrome P450 [Actinoplanes sp. TBRC 11911]NMO56320.1 cytochrome P450 [Actinoplanes sp. TBRC 11911]